MYGICLSFSVILFALASDGMIEVTGTSQVPVT